MTDHHLTRDLLWGLVTEDSLEELLPQLLAHLSETCPHCAEVLLQAEVELQPNPASPLTQATSTSYEAAIHGALKTIEADMRARPSDGLSAGHWLALLRLPERDRCQAVCQEPERYGRLELAERLLAVCRAKLPGHPHEILALTTLTRCVLRHAPEGPAPEGQIARETYALAMAHHGNALKILGQLDAAAQLLSDARFWLDSSGSVDPMVEAEVDWLEGSLLTAQRRFHAAAHLLKRSVTTWREVGEIVEEGKALLSLSVAERQLDNLATCQLLIARAIDCFEESENHQLAIFARHNLAECYCESGEYGEAEQLVVGHRQQVEKAADPLTSLRFLWVDAKIACGLGEEKKGEALFQSVRQGFADLNLPYDSALAALELAALFLRQGRTAEVKGLVGEMVEVFDERDIHRETLASLILFQDAVELECVSAASMREFSTYLERARRDPAYAFRLPS